MHQPMSFTACIQRRPAVTLQCIEACPLIDDVPRFQVWFFMDIFQALKTTVEHPLRQSWQHTLLPFGMGSSFK